VPGPNNELMAEVKRLLGTIQMQFQCDAMQSVVHHSSLLMGTSNEENNGLFLLDITKFLESAYQDHQFITPYHLPVSPHP